MQCHGHDRIYLDQENIMKKLLAILLAGTIGMGFASCAFSATDEAKASYMTAKDAADAEYKAGRAKCDSLAGNPKDVCVEEAKAARTGAKADAEARYRNTPKARAKARVEMADADYDVAKAKCNAKTGNDKDVCIKEAKAARIAAKEDAKADKKETEARADARKEKLNADYKVAIEKCDALAGAAKDHCVSTAKAQYGKS
jgi:hypothetical protein